ncbi:3672_t:CDS:2, partial [Ambispora leptoticha]
NNDNDEINSDSILEEFKLARSKKAAQISSKKDDKGKGKACEDSSFSPPPPQSSPQTRQYNKFLQEEYDEYLAHAIAAAERNTTELSMSSLTVFGGSHDESSDGASSSKKQIEEIPKFELIREYLNKTEFCDFEINDCDIESIQETMPKETEQDASEVIETPLQPKPSTSSSTIPEDGTRGKQNNNDNNKESKKSRKRKNTFDIPISDRLPPRRRKKKVTNVVEYGDEQLLPSSDADDCEDQKKRNLTKRTPKNIRQTKKLKGKKGKEKASSDMDNDEGDNKDDEDEEHMNDIQKEMLRHEREQRLRYFQEVDNYVLPIEYVEVIHDEKEHQEQQEQLSIASGSNS